MTLGNNFYTARKKQGLSQEEVAEKFGVSRQTISKWELDETLPDKTSEEKQQKIDWTTVWSEKFPVLATYQKTVHVEMYASQLTEMLKRLKRDYGYNDQDAFLVLKDILAQIWNNK